MCHIWAKQCTRTEISAGDIDVFLKGAHHVPWVGITGGEPFLRSDIGELVLSILNNVRHIRALHFATNGTLVSAVEKIIRTVRNERPAQQLVFSLSIDGPPALHDDIRGGRGLWEKTMRTFLLLKRQHNVKPQISYTLMCANMGKFTETIKAIRDYAPGFSFNDITVNLFQHSSFYYENLDVPVPVQGDLREEILKILAMDRDRLSLNNFLRRRYLRLYLNYPLSERFPLRCQAMSMSCFVDPYGDVFPCTQYPKKIINIHDSQASLLNVWNTPLARKVHAVCSGGLCPGCWNTCDTYSAMAGSLFRLPRCGSRDVGRVV